jgi:hypothetical protein
VIHVKRGSELVTKCARSDPAHEQHSQVHDGYAPEELDVFPVEVALNRIAAAAQRI